MSYVKTQNGEVAQYPYHLNLLKKENPEVSFPRTMSDELLASYGVYNVEIQTAPSFNPKTQIIESSYHPVLVDGVWTITMNVVDLDEEGIAVAASTKGQMQRDERRLKLLETDWWAVSDRTMTSEQIAYRTALRNLPTHSNWPYLDDDDWPVKP